MKIKNIIFDLGGVIINLDYKKTSDEFKKLGVNNFDEFYTQSQQTKLFDEFETGKISAQSFRDQLRDKLDLAVSDQKLDNAWNALLLDLPIDRLNYIKSLRDEYRVFLFSNTNEIHLKEVFSIAEREHGIKSLDDYFEKTYYSHIFGRRKPHASSFLALMKENNLTPSETLFIDDSHQHILGAKEAGIHTMHLTKDMLLLETKFYINNLELEAAFDAIFSEEKIDKTTSKFSCCTIL